jgi:formylglycine-generating enzyme required for sulfatase activity
MIANASVRPRTTSVAMVCLALWAVSFVCLPVRAEKQEQQGGASFAQQKTRSSPAADDVNQSPKNSPVLLTAPFDAARARIVQKAWAKRLGKPSPVERNSIGMELILIPPGKFTMGSPVAENGRKEDETQVEVTLTKAFYIGKTEVTQAQWHVVIGTAPWKGEPAHISQGVNFPATNVSWDDAQAFCTKLSKKENATYRLPTEAEWEYACRAGTTTRFYSGDDESTLANYEWCGGVVGQTQEVGLKQANPFGLHDMHGNVWERCQDVYLQNHPGGTDPLVSTGGSQRTFRGGIWSMNSDTARSAHRRWLQPVDLDNALGFRVVRISDK